MKFRRLTIIILAILLLIGLVAGFLLYSFTREAPDKQLAVNMYEHWKANHVSLIKEYGSPTDINFVTVWFQNFATGYVAYNVTDREAILFFGQTGTFRKLPTPNSILTPGALPNVNDTLLQGLLEGIDPEERVLYSSMVYERVRYGRVGILGGIGTLYLQEKLLKDFGPPLANEVRIDNVLHIKGPDYELLVGLPIGSEGPFAPGDADPPRRVSFLHSNNRFDDYRELPSTYKQPYSPTRLLRSVIELYENNYKKPWFWVLTTVGTPLATYLVAMSSLLLLARRRGSALFSRNLLLSLAAKPLLATPGLSRWALFIGYNHRLSELPGVSQTSRDYFDLPAKDPKGSTVRLQTARSPLLERIAQAVQPQRPVLILGNGGAGKSTVLNRLTYLAVEKRLPSPLKGFVPLLVPADYYSEKLTKAIADTLRERDGVAVNEEVIESQLQSGRFLVLFDGVSEVIADKQESLEEIVRTGKNADYRTCRFVISTRRLDLTPAGVSTFDLQPLDSTTIRDLLNEYSLGDRSKNLVLEQLKSFADKPIDALLFSMIIAASEDRILSSTRSQIYERYFRKLLKTSQDRTDNLWSGWKKALETLAFYLLIDAGRRGVGLPHERLMDCISEKKEEHETKEGLANLLRRLYHLPVDDELDLLNQLEASGLLRRERRWRFAHDTFEEYFAASYIVSYFDSNEMWPPLDQLREARKPERELSELFEFVNEMMEESGDELWKVSPKIPLAEWLSHSG